jgi:putative photosynthetic complex assembly protein
MSAHHNLDLPKPLLVAAGLLMVGSLLLAYWGRQTGIGRTAVLESSVVAAYDLRLLPQGDGTIHVYLTDGSLVKDLSIEQAGFVSGVLRGFSRGRSLAQITADTPFSLIRYADGRLVLQDTATLERVVLDVFGPTNAKTFVDLWVQSAAMTSSAHSVSAHSVSATVESNQFASTYSVMTAEQERLTGLTGGH